MHRVAKQQSLARSGLRQLAYQAVLRCNRTCRPDVSEVSLCLPELGRGGTASVASIRQFSRTSISVSSGSIGRTAAVCGPQCIQKTTFDQGHEGAIGARAAWSSP